MTWAEDVRRANDAIDWIEERQGPLKPDNFATIETTVSQVRALREVATVDDERISEIRARLEAATPGPWVDCESDGGTWVDGVGPGGLLVCNTGVIANRYSVANTRFIAHAPADIAHLLARADALEAERDAERVFVKRLQGEVDRLAAERDEWRDGEFVERQRVERLTAERDALRARAERAEAAIRAAISEIDRGCQWDARAALAAAGGRHDDQPQWWMGIDL